jgi:hypothetical protein
MADVVRLAQPRREWFADARGRSLRATWHEDAGTLVLSIWEGERCMATFHFDPADAARLTALTAEVVRAWADGLAADTGAATS